MARRPVQSKIVREVRVDARELFTTTPNSHEEDLEIAADAIIRLKVQHGDADVEVTRAHDALKSIAAKVIVQRPAKSKAPTPETPQVETLTARQAVLDLAEESSFHTKPKLIEFLEKVLAEVGI